MVSLIHLISIVILLSIDNVLGSPSKTRVKRVSNAQSDTDNYFKHEVRLTTQSGLCSGTIISDKSILTAAHCVVVKGTDTIINIDQKVMEVTVGIVMVDNEFELQTVRLVEAIYIPDYFFNAADTAENLQNMIGDIAVLKLNYGLGIGIDPRIEALLLPTQEYETAGHSLNNHLVFTGFGGTKAIYNPEINDLMPGEFPSYLQFSEAEVVLPAYSCPLIGNPQLKMCAKLVNGDAGVCAGDSGGALIYLEEKTILAVLSYGAKVCKEIPGTYTRVFPYVSFIKNAVNDLPDPIMRRVSFKEHPNYQKTLRENMYRYHWVYVPDLMKSMISSV